MFWRVIDLEPNNFDQVEIFWEMSGIYRTAVLVVAGFIGVIVCAMFVKKSVTDLRSQHNELLIGHGFLGDLPGGEVTFYRN